jgi:hypothetical protein
VHGNWRLAPPVGPATDLWALGALLFRAVQGHPPFPEDDAAELVQTVCAEPPAFAEDCGPLRPVIESLLRQDPTERPDVEEVRGWLRSLIRSAPEPGLGHRTVTMPSYLPGAAAGRHSELAPGSGHGDSGGPGNGNRLPILRRRGELVRRRRPAEPAVAHGRHKRGRAQGRQRSPRRLGLALLGLILLGLAAAVAYAVVFLPPAGENRGAGSGAGTGVGAGSGGDRTGPADTAGPAPGRDGEGGPGGADEPDSRQPQSTDPTDLPRGFVLRRDPQGFQVAVPEGWRRRDADARGRIRYIGGDYELVVVPGRDTVDGFGGDPMIYQQDREGELQAFRDSQWASASGLRRIDVGKTAMAEGTFTWKDGSGREVYARNLAMILDGRYHVLLVIGPSDEQDAVTRTYEQAADTYRPTA